MPTVRFEMKVGLLSDEEQKEYDYIEGKYKRRSIVFPFERARILELRKIAEKNLLEGKID